MLTLPDAIVPILAPFATLFTNPTWRKAQLLMVGAILATGQRTVAAALRVMGRSDQRDYARYHEVLNRAVWSPREAARILLWLLLQYLDHGDGPLIFGIDETLERRRGARIRARGIRFCQGRREDDGRFRCRRLSRRRPRIIRDLGCRGRTSLVTAAGCEHYESHQPCHGKHRRQSGPQELCIGHIHGEHCPSSGSPVSRVKHFLPVHLLCLGPIAERHQCGSWGRQTPG